MVALTRRELREAERAREAAALASAAPAPAAAAHAPRVPAWTSGAAIEPVKAGPGPSLGDDRPEPSGTARAHTVASHGVTSSLDPRSAMPAARP
ncbi:MAG: hypothetical protein AAGC49_14835, partial [Brevundimonas sp.]